MSKESPEQLLARLVARSTLEPAQVQTVGLDVLDFVMRVLDQGGEIGVRYPRTGRHWIRQAINIPGMTIGVEE